jgi:hypothetical protein
MYFMEALLGLLFYLCMSWGCVVFRFSLLVCYFADTCTGCAALPCEFKVGAMVV